MGRNVHLAKPLIVYTVEIYSISIILDRRADFMDFCAFTGRVCLIA